MRIISWNCNGACEEYCEISKEKLIKNQKLKGLGEEEYFSLILLMYSVILLKL